MNKISLFSLVLICLSFVSCKSSDDDDNTSSNQYTDCNRWIVNTMRDHYLWKEEIPGNDNLDFNSSPESFFKSLLSMKDGKNSSAGHYYYSYIEKNKNYKATTKGINDDSDSYGIDFVRYSIPILNTTKYEDYEYDRVMYVLSDSPAEKSGLKRGDWITRIDGKEINIANADYKKLLNGAARELTVYHVFPGLSTTISLLASTAVKNDPIYYSAVINTGDKRIGYLVYNEFSTGPNEDYNDHTYDNELIDLFVSKFKDVNEFVLDLRYNPGGYLSCSRLLSRLLVPSSHMNDIFCKLTDANNKVTTYAYKKVDGEHSLKGFTSLNLSRLYIIATGSTASASEAVINGLSPHVPVTIIGTKTEGKNVGSDNFDGDNKYAWDIQPITFHITSSASNDYSSGLSPNYVMNELDSKANPDFLPLGDLNEYLLNKAISLIGGQTTSSSIASRKTVLSTSNITLTPFGDSFITHKIKGTIQTPISVK